MQKIMVEPIQLENVASVVENRNTEYQRLYHLLFQEVDNVSSVWQGEDNIAFTNQIKGFNDDFNRISIVLTQYVEFLRNSSRTYRECQSQLVSNARSLTN
jgi:WXG100 family type VII secretion target